MDGCPSGLGLVVKDKPTEFSCTQKDTNMLATDDKLVRLNCHALDRTPLLLILEKL